MIDGQKRSFMKFQDVRAFLDSVLDEDIHTKRVDSLANATLGVMTGASLGVAIIGNPDKGFSGCGFELIAGLQVELGLERVDLVGGDGRDDVDEGVDDGSMLGQIEG